MSEKPTALLQAPGPEGRPLWLRFGPPQQVHVARSLAEVVPALEEVERATAEDGAWAAGFLAYEAGPAFDPALDAHPPGDLPLAWWGLFDTPEELDTEELDAERPGSALEWRPLVSEDAYHLAIEEIRELIAAGETYQVNYTFPLEATFEGDPLDLFLGLARAQRGGCCGFLDLGEVAICSASPELFFELEGDVLRSRPMKGTARRGRTLAEDLESRRALQASAKDRAENVMIVDMVRNDLGKIASPGSVTTDKLFEVETYPTLLQLTSTVSGRTRAGLVEIFRALYPCASITGAPKVATSRIIRRLEPHPRGAYTGALGWIAPKRRARFNVAIRTVTVEREAGRARYGVGSGIVWDSDAASEYEECRTKARVLAAPAPEFELLETLLWRPKSGYFLLERHLERLLASAEYFAIPTGREAIARALEELERGFAPERHRVRLLVDRRGRPRAEAAPMPCSGRRGFRAALATSPIDPDDVFLFHKTTHRRVYDDALAQHPECDEVLLHNPRGELTELARGNLVLRIDGQYLTPPVSAGLLAGTYRAELLERDRIREARLPIAELERASAAFLINSVRGWVRLELQGC